MNNFKVFIETDHTHYVIMQSENPDTASKLELMKVLVLDPENDLGFSMPIFQVRGSELPRFLGG